MKKPVRILAVDDSLTMRKLIEVVFKDSAFELHLAETGAQAIALAAQVAPDIVLMDFVLPDMKGVEICQALQRIEKAKRSPILVTSAKGSKIIDEFKDFPNVVGFLPKPFRPDALRAAVQEALTKETGVEEAQPAPRAESKAEAPRVARPAAHPQGQEVARVLFASLQNALARIPEWMGELGTQRPDRFFAARLITPAVVQAVMDAAGAAAQERPRAAPPARLEGTTDLISTLVLLRGLEAAKRTGSLNFQRAEHKASIHFREGKILSASLDQPESWGSDIEAFAVKPELLAEAKEQQRKTGTPYPVNLAQQGAISAGDLARALRKGSKSSVRLLLETGWRFQWSDAALPAWAEAQTTPISVDAVELDGLRRQTLAMPEGTDEVSPADAFARCTRFSQRAMGLDLTREERALLLLVDRRHTVEEIVERGKLELAAAQQMLARLELIGLIYRVGSAPGRHAPEDAPPAPVVLGFQDGADRSLELLRERWAVRRKPLRMVLRNRMDDLSVEDSGAVSALIVDASSREFDAGAWLRRLQQQAWLSTQRTIALCEVGDSERRRDLTSLGYDVVLAKPFLVEELEAYLTTP